MNSLKFFTNPDSSAPNRPSLREEREKRVSQNEGK